MTTPATPASPAASSPDAARSTAAHTLPAIRRAVMRAVLAPSTHNTQPWRFAAGPTSLDLFVDPGRGLAVIDPHSRQQVISCGAALLGARVSLAGDGLAVTMDLLPDPADPNHLARLQILPARGPRIPRRRRWTAPRTAGTPTGDSSAPSRSRPR